MLSLSDDELAALLSAARPIPARDRDQFLRAVASELEKHEVIGVGVIHRVTAKIQRQHLNRPRYAHTTGKWDR